MSPRMEADFDWGDVQTSTPIHAKNDYELTIKSVRGSAWPKKDAHGNPTGEVVRVVRFRPEIVGVLNSEGELETELDGKNIAGASCEEMNLWVHSEGGRRMAKSSMMAVLGYNPRDEAEERTFNEFLAESGSDLSAVAEENEAGDGYVLSIGDGWKDMFVGKNVRAHMEPETRQVEGRDDITSQNYARMFPVN